MMETLYGTHPVREALKAGRRDCQRLFVEKRKPSPRLKQILRLAESRGVPAEHVGEDRIAKISGTALHQGICLEVGPYPLENFHDLLQSSPDFLLLLDQIVDPNNLGAILRTALCAGVDGVIISKDRAAGPLPSVSRASAGALEHIRLTRVVNMASTIKTLKKEGFWIFGADADGQTSVFSVDWTAKIGIVIGGEGKGVRMLVKKNCDALVKIPLKGPVQSLNASAASAVILYEAARRRGL